MKVVREGGGLRKEVRLIDVVTLGAGTAVGVALFSIFAPAAQVAGPGMLISLALAAAPMIVFAVIYAFMGSALPLSGASFEWPTRFIHPSVGFMVAWLRILGSTGAMVVLAQVLVQYVSMVVYVPLKPAMLALFTVFFLLNLFGISIAARAQTIMFSLLSIVLAVFVVGALPHVEAANFTPLLARGWVGVLAAVPLLVSLFLGIETATEIGEEVRNARTAIVRGIAICVAVTLLIYVAVSVVTLGALGPERLALSQAPLLETAGLLFGDTAKLFIVAAATLAITKSLNAVLMIFSRFLFAMGRAGVLPTALARIHPRWGTPHVATATAFGFCVLGLLLPDNLVFLFLAVNIPTMLKYLCTCISAMRMVDSHPEIYARAVFRPRRGTIKVWAWVGVVCAIAIIIAGFGADWRPYAVLGAWAVVGALYWLVQPRTRRIVTEAN